MKHVWNMPSGNTSYQQSTVITQPDEQLFLLCTQQWSKLSAECPLMLVFFLPYVQPRCHVKNHCSCYSHGVMIFDNRFQEINSRKTSYGWVIIAPLYWQGFHTDQNLMGFIINNDDSSPLCLAFVGEKQNGRLTFLRLLPIDLAHPAASSEWERLTSFAFEPADVHGFDRADKKTPH